MLRGLIQYNTQLKMTQIRSTLINTDIFLSCAVASDVDSHWFLMWIWFLHLHQSLYTDPDPAADSDPGIKLSEIKI